VYAVCALLTLCVAILEGAFISNDFSFALVADHSSTTTPTHYKATAMWSSQAGSLLLWAWVLSIAASAVLFVTRRRHREIVPWATAVLMGIGVFFIGLMLIAPDARPFTQLSPAPAEGAGLNPLLRHWAMLMHPPMLYSGYVFLAVPFAFAIGALISRRLDASWIRMTRRFALIAWTFLSVGLLLGAFWSYNELGWGGYWAWDPVENAALMPWLITTAFLHSVMVQEKRGMLRTWNVALIITAFSLALLGTFLVRSGVLQSIHAFGDSTVGPPLLGLIAVVVIGSTALVVSRAADLRSERRIDSLASRESVFLVNNLLLVALCAVIFWGTFFPLVSELFTGEKASLAAPWFDSYTTPLAVLLVLFAGVGPLLAWRRVSWSSARRVFLWPALAALGALVLLLAATDAGDDPWALAVFVLASFTLVALGQELWRGAGARRSLSGGSVAGSVLAVAARNRRRYGGYVVHAGLVVLLVGIAASSSFQTNRDVRLRPGESADVGDYRLTYERPTVDVTNERIAFGAILRVERDGERFAVLAPTRNYFRPQGEPSGPISSYFEGEATSEVGLESGVRQDLWTAVQPGLGSVEQTAAAADRGFRQCVRGAPGTPSACDALAAIMRRAAADPRLRPAALEQISLLQGQTIRRVAESYGTGTAPATFRVNVNPMVTWLWIGALVALAGALIAVWPAPGARRRRVTSAAAARVGRGLSRA
jgi:cytochrome c-type biogenesis protein CcmF